jgi:hypothetical protein
MLQLGLFERTDVPVTGCPTGLDETGLIAGLSQRTANPGNSPAQGLVVDFLPIPEVVEQLPPGNQAIPVFDQENKDAVRLAGDADTPIPLQKDLMPEIEGEFAEPVHDGTEDIKKSDKSPILVTITCQENFNNAVVLLIFPDESSSNKSGTTGRGPAYAKAIPFPCLEGNNLVRSLLSKQIWSVVGFTLQECSSGTPGFCRGIGGRPHRVRGSSNG